MCKSSSLKKKTLLRYILKHPNKRWNTSCPWIGRFDIVFPFFPNWYTNSIQSLSQSQKAIFKKDKFNANYKIYNGKGPDSQNNLGKYWHYTATIINVLVWGLMPQINDIK